MWYVLQSLEMVTTNYRSVTRLLLTMKSNLLLIKTRYLISLMLNESVDFIEQKIKDKSKVTLISGGVWLVLIYLTNLLYISPNIVMDKSKVTLCN